ncbi:37S ribosomal protein MRP4 [Drechslerella dactyloides]|uniref:37S ribosomal protein MRP4 n=1 Tax=Drechslerella dactyloides TaxID=74499 RepID=A0AAD6IXA9_DREDA|nr:37S ribosomal protein MRP4 [Drechslerella dactyloides]
MIPRRVAALSSQPSNTTTPSGSDAPPPEGPLLVDFDEQVKHAASKPVQVLETPRQRPTLGDQPLTNLDSYYIRKAARAEESKLGANIEPHYKPHELITNPPSPRDITLELLLASGAHLGHATALWNPGNQRYIFGIRQGIHLISLDVIAAHLRRAAKIVHGVSRSGGLIIFVGTRDGQERAIVEAARRTRGYYITERWIPGTITNKDQLLAGQKLRVLDAFDREVKLTAKQKLALQERMAREAESRLSAGVKADPSQFQTGDTLQVPAGMAAARPDLVVCMNPLENRTMLQECAQYRIPTIGIIDTDVDPTCVTYPIPANDDRRVRKSTANETLTRLQFGAISSLRSVQLIVGILGKAGQEGRLARYEAEKARREGIMQERRRLREAKRREDEATAKAEMEQEAEDAASEARVRELEGSATPISYRD